MCFVRATGLVACRIWIGRFFFRFFFSFRVKIRDDGTLHFESRWRERPGIFLPERGLDATRLRGQKVFDYMRLYLSNVSIDRVGLEEKRRRSKAKSVTRAGGQNFGSLLRHFEAFFFTERELFSITDQNFVYIFVNSTGWSRCRR